MRRFGIVFWLVLVVASGFATFKVKYAVQDIEDELNRVRRQTISEQQEIRVLTAEWTYLNQPERLADLNRRFLALTPVAPKQLQTAVADIPLRPPMAADVVVASAQSEAKPAGGAPAGSPRLPAAAPVMPATLTAAGKQGGLVRVAKAGPPPAIPSLDALVAQVVEAR